MLRNVKFTNCFVNEFFTEPHRKYLIWLDKFGRIKIIIEPVETIFVVRRLNRLLQPGELHGIEESEHEQYDDHAHA